MAPYPAISVVMGVFNNASLLPETLASVQAQTEAGSEFIIVNDGSSDPRVGEILTDYARQDSRIRVISKPNEGLTQALIDGCAVAQGSYIARIDVGDVMLPERMERQRAVLDAHPEVVLVTCWTECCGPEWEPLYLVEGKASGPVEETHWVANVLPTQLDEDLMDGPTHHGSSMFRADTYRAAGGYRRQFYYGQDWDLWYRLAELGAFAGVQATLYRCRIFPNGISMRNDAQQRSIHACALGAFWARRHAGDEGQFLQGAAAIRPLSSVPSRNSQTPPSCASGDYFIAEALRRNGNGRCRRYFWHAIKGRPFMAKNWARLAQTIFLRRTPEEPTDPCSHIHIAIMAPDCCHGSVGSVAWRHAVELSRWFHVHVVSQAIPELPNDRIHAVIVNPPRWNFLRRFCHVPNALSFELSARHLLSALCRQAPITTVWCHGHASVVLAACPLRKRYGFRVVMTTHGDIRDRPAGTYSRELTWYYRLLTGPAYRRSDAVQAISPYMADLARNGGAHDVRVIPNGIEPAEIGLHDLPARNVDTYCPKGIVRLLYVGNLLPIKGLEVLFKAMTYFQKGNAAGTGDNDLARGMRVQLQLAGGGGEQARYEHLAADLGIDKLVSFLGPVSRADLSKLYLASDALCVPSLSEALSIAGLEGMICGLPVIGSRTGGIPYIVEDSKTGRLSEPGDVASLVDSIRDVCQSRERLASLGQAAQRRAAEHFSWPRISEHLREMVPEPLGRRTGPASGAFDPGEL